MEKNQSLIYSIVTYYYYYSIKINILKFIIPELFINKKYKTIFNKKNDGSNRKRPSKAIESN